MQQILLAFSKCVTIPVRYARHKPWVPKFRLIRQMQPWDGPVDIHGDGAVNARNETVSDLRQRLRRSGLLPPLLFQDRPVNIGHTGQVTDPYVPPEGDGRATLLSSKLISQQAEALLDKGKSYRETMKIRNHEPSFSAKRFVNEAELIYKEAHELLPRFVENQSRLFELVTEKAFLEMTAGLKYRTLRWKFLQSIEPPRVVHIRTQELMSKQNIFGQVTVRFHTQQSVAIFDRFGRLLYGSPTTPVDVLEYVVFEKHIADEYGIWRIHAKIFPPNAPPMGNYLPTQRCLEDAKDSTAVTPVPQSNYSSSSE